MRKIILSALVFVLMFCVPVFAQDAQLYLMTAEVTAGTTGTAKGFGFQAETMTCHTSTSGTAPTTVVYEIQCSVDNTTYSVYASKTYTVASPDTKTIHIVNKPARFCRAKYTSKTGGDATTAVSIMCSGGR